MKSLWIILLGLLSFNTFSASPRLVVLNPYSVEMLFAIGAGDTIIGTVEYADYPKEATKIPRVGRYDFIDFEAMMLLNPDAVVIDSKSMSPQLISRLESLGFVLIDTYVSQLEQIPERLQQLGKKTGLEGQASNAAQKFTQTLVALKQQYQNKAPINVFFQIWPEPLTTSASSWLNEIIEGCGGKNVFGDSVSEYPQVSVEQVISASPEVIIKPVHGDINQVSSEWQVWPEIPAVTNNHIFNIDGNLVHRTGPRVLTGMAQMCEMINAARLQKQRKTL